VEGSSVNGVGMDIRKDGEAQVEKSHGPIRSPVETAAWVVLIAMAFLGLTLILRPSPKSPRDFFMDYASARNLLSGRPVYTPIDRAFRQYMGFDVSIRIPYCGHPPTSVLLVLPFAGLAYVPAAVAWNVLSLVLLAASLRMLIAELRFDFSLSHLVLLSAALCLWPPLWVHLGEGQLGIPILFLLTLAWRAARHGRDALAGGMIGLAAAIKVFPVVLIAYFMFRRRFRLAIAGALGLVSISGATLLITGPEAFRDYLFTVLPTLQRWNKYGQNASLTGFFSRLLSPPLAGAAALMASVLVAAAVCVRSARADFDQSFALAVTGTLLITTLTWPHSLVILLLPLAVYVARLAYADSLSRWLAGAGWLLMAVPQPFLPGFDEHKSASVVVSLTALSVNFYGLLAFFLAQARLQRTCQLAGPRTSRIPNPPETLLHTVRS
jgi:Glycosyltransferase family 87